MSTKKQIEKQTQEALYNELKSKGVGTNENLIYLSEGLYINSKGEIIGFFMPSLLYPVLLGFNDKRHDNVTTNDKIFIYLTQVNFFKL
jgi:hypothetical protein